MNTIQGLNIVPYFEVNESQILANDNNEYSKNILYTYSSQENLKEEFLEGNNSEDKKKDFKINKL